MNSMNSEVGQFGEGLGLPKTIWWESGPNKAIASPVAARLRSLKHSENQPT